MPGVVERLEEELRAAFPTEWTRKLRVMRPDDSEAANFRGAVALSENEQDLQNIGIYTRQMFFGK
jgi:actin-related protein